MKRFIMISAGLLFFASCASTSDPQLKAKIEPFFGSPSKAKYAKAQKFFRPMPYAVGQYVVIGTTEKDGKRSITRTSLVGRESGGWVIESYSLSESQEGVIQMLIKGLEQAAKTGKPDDIEIVWVKMKDKEGKVQTIEGPMLMMAKAMYKGSLENLSVKIESFVDGGVITVPAGSFAGTNTIKTSAKFLGKTYKSTGWYHYAVPINGMVKSVSDDGKMVMELLSFGYKGAVSQFNR